MSSWYSRAGVVGALTLGLVASACSSAPSAPAAASGGAAAPKSAATSAPAASAASSSQSSAAPTGQPINMGLVGEFTGQFAAIGQSKAEGTQLAADLINQNGGIMGRPVKITQVNASDPADAVPAVRQMLATDNVSTVIGFSVKTFQTALPIVNQSKMVSFTFIGSPTIDHTAMPYSFRMAPSDAVVGAAMAQYAKNKGYKKIALVFDAEEGAQTLVAPIESAAKTLGLEVVAKPNIPLNVPSYQGEILQVVNAKPDAILMQIDPQEAGTFFKQMRSLGAANIPVIGSDLTSGNEWIKAVGEQEAAKQVVSMVSSGETTPAAKYFTDAYQKKYNHPARTYAVHFYDGVNVAALAMIDAKSTDPTKYVNDVLDVTNEGSGKTVVYNFADGAKALAAGKKIKYSGAGSPMTFDPKYHTVAGTFQAVQAASGGKLNTVMTIPATDIEKLLS